jgi:hypothetical protein
MGTPIRPTFHIMFTIGKPDLSFFKFIGIAMKMNHVRVLVNGYNVQEYRIRTFMRIGAFFNFLVAQKNGILFTRSEVTQYIPNVVENFVNPSAIDL